MIKVFKLFIAVTAAATLVACGGDSGTVSPTLAATANLSAPATASNVAGLVNQSFTYPSGVPALGTDSSTTLVFTNAAASPAFSIASGGLTAAGTTSFGSCIFNIGQSNFPSAHPLATGKVVTVNPCLINVATSGAAANGSASSRATIFVLGITSSTLLSLLITVNANGDVFFSGIRLGNIPVAPVTGS